MQNLHKLIGLLTLWMGLLSPVAAQVISIDSVRNSTLGATVSIRGVVTLAQGRFVFIQDSSAGINTFQSTGALADSVASGFIAKGDSIEVTGEFDEFNGLQQISNVSAFTRINRDNPLPDYQVIPLAEVLANGEAYESELVRIFDLSFSTPQAGTWDAGTSYDVTDGTTTLTLRTASGADNPSIDGTDFPGEPFIFEGFIGEFQGTYQLSAWEPEDAYQPFALAIGHNNDAESQLINAGGNNTDFGGAARFKATVDSLRDEAAGVGYNFMLVTSGDNYLPGPEFNASLDRDPALPYYDAILIDSLRYDALCIGNHDFDFGPEVLANLISDASVNMPTFLSANLDFSGEPDLDALVAAGRIAPSKIIERNGRKIGIVGLTTPNLPFISSPGDVVVDPNVATIAQAQVDALTDSGANIIVLISHLQGIGEDTTLIKSLRNVDVVVAGGGSELLGNAASTYFPGDVPTLSYPLEITDAVGDTVPVVTTTGELRYLGYLAAAYSARGELLQVQPDARVIAVDSTVFGEDMAIQMNVVDSVAAYLVELDNTIIATTQPALDGRRSAIRSQETNQGDLIADAWLWQANRLAPQFGAPAVDVAIANGGGIRNDEIIPASSDISLRKTFDISPFGNVITIVEDISPAQFKEIVENAVSRVDTSSGTGRFGQYAGFKIVYDTAETRQLIDNGVITQVGTRVRTITLDDGTPIVKEGQVVPDAPFLTLATANFLADGGDQYPLANNPRTLLGVTDQQTLAAYLTMELDSLITSAQYPEGGDGRTFLRGLDPDSVLTIEQARLFPEGDTVTFEGIVTRAKGRLTHLQADDFAISTFAGGGDYRDSTESGFISQGALVRIKGERADFNELQQINPVVEFTKLSDGNPLPEPQPLTISEYNFGVEGERYESELVRINGLLVDNNPGGSWDDNTSYTVFDLTDTVELRTPGASDTDIPTQAIPSGYFTFEGVLNDRFGTYRPFPIDSTDITPRLVLTILHNNDAESQLIDAGSGAEDFGGAARFKAVVDMLKEDARFLDGSPVVTLSSGDNFLAGPEFSASLDRNPSLPYYDAVVVDSIGYDALAIGNHEFDFGPEVLANFIEDVSATMPPFLSANLDFSGEPSLAALEGSGRIAKRVVIQRGPEQIGVVGATTTLLASISSPGGVSVSQAVADSVQAQVDALTAQGVENIILISHLQSIEEDSALVSQLRDVDIVIAGGGDELLANPDDLLLPGDAPSGPYPRTAPDANGETVFLVTTAGSYKYVGRLVVHFEEGEVAAINDLSGPVRVSTVAPDAVMPDSAIQNGVVDSIEAYVADLAENIIATTEVDLDGLRASVRTKETNLGNLIADAFLWQANELAPSFGAPEADIALANGGGIRNDNIIPANSDITELTTFDILPFSNFITIVPDITPESLKEIMENAVSRVEFTDGRHAQIAGFTLVVDTAGTAQVIDAGTGNITTAGSRVKCIILDDSTYLVKDGVIEPGAPDVNIAIVDFLARGGDQYPFDGAGFTILGVTYQQALENYLVRELNGLVTEAQYPADTTQRNLRVDAGFNCDDLVTHAGLLAQGFRFEAYPNPVRSQLTLVYDLPQAAEVDLAVYSLMGQRLQTLAQGQQPAGVQTVHRSLERLPAGMYLIRLAVDGQVSTKRLNVLR